MKEFEAVLLLIFCIIFKGFNNIENLHCDAKSLLQYIFKVSEDHKFIKFKQGGFLQESSKLRQK